MVRCIEYYDKCESDGCNWCDKEPETVRTIQEYIKFYKELEILGVPRDATIRGVSETAARPLIRICDENIRQKAIIKCSERLNPNSKGGRGNTKKLTESKVKEILEEVEIELRNERANKIREERAASGIQEPEEKPEISTNVINEEDGESQETIAIQETIAPDEPTEPEEQLTENTITPIEVQIYFNVMEKIQCNEDIPKHRKRMDMMFKNGTLRMVK